MYPKRYGKNKGKSSQILCDGLEECVTCPSHHLADDAFLAMFPVMTVPLIVTAGYGAVLLIGTLVSAVLLIRRRSYQPIKFRSAIFILLGAAGAFSISIFLVGASLCTQTSAADTCSAIFCSNVEWVLWISYALLLGSYFLRCFRVILLHMSRQGLDARAGRSYQAINRDSDSSPMVLKESTLLVYFAAIVVITGAVKLALQLSQLDEHFGGYGCEEAHLSYGAQAVGVLEVIACLVCILKLRTIRDDFGVTSELSVVCATWGFSTVLLVLILLLKSKIDQGNEDFYLTMHTVTICVRNAVLIAVSLVVPALRASPFVTLWSHYDALTSLDSVLRDRTCMKYFRDFLMAESNVSLFLCWVEIELYKDLDEHKDDMTSAAVAIYQKHIREDAEFFVPIDSYTRNQLEQRMQMQKHADVYMFTELQQELYNIMAAEFPRFHLSQQCRACLTALEDEESLKNMLQQSQMI
jgi:hypothetical protein